MIIEIGANVANAKRGRRLGGAAALDILMLSVVTSQQSVKGKILVQVGPVNAIGRNLDVTQLPRRSSCQPGIFRNWEANLAPALHRNNDLTVLKDSRTCAID